MATADGLSDWRYLLGSVEATYQASALDGVSAFTMAATFACGIAELADAANHHPDIDVRYPGVVHVMLMTHEIDGLSDLDLELARAISELAKQSGAVAAPASTKRVEIAIDALDIEAIRPFWKAILGYRGIDSDGAQHDLRDPHRRGPAIWFQQMDAPRTDRNRFHLDVSVPHDEAEARVATAIAAGGVLVSDARAKAFWVLADAEGNEACVCTWQDRD